MKSITMLFVSKPSFISLDREIRDSFVSDVKEPSVNSFYVKWPLSVAGWYIEDNKAGKAFIAEYEPAIEEAALSIPEAPITKVPKAKAKSLSMAELLMEYGKLSSLAKKSANDKKRIADLAVLIAG